MNKFIKSAQPTKCLRISIAADYPSIITATIKIAPQDNQEIALENAKALSRELWKICNNPDFISIKNDNLDELFTHKS